MTPAQSRCDPSVPLLGPPPWSHGVTKRQHRVGTNFPCSPRSPHPSMWVSNDGEVPPGRSEAPCSRWYGHFFGSKSWRRHRADLGGAEIQELLRGSRPEALAGREQDRAEAVVKVPGVIPNSGRMNSSPPPRGAHCTAKVSMARSSRVTPFSNSMQHAKPAARRRAAVQMSRRSAAGARFSMVVR